MRSRIRRYVDKLPWRGALYGMCCGLAAWLLVQPAMVRGLDEWFTDGWFHYRGRRPTEARVVIVGLDEATLDARTEPLMNISEELALVVPFLREEGAAAIGIDVIVPDNFKELPAIQHDAEKLGAAILEADNVVLAHFWADTENARLRPLPQWLLAYHSQDRPTDLGFVNTSEDPDRFLRHQVLDLGPDELGFALALFAVAEPDRVSWGPQDELLVDGRRVPLDDKHRMRINFVGPPNSIETVAFRDVLDSAEGKRPLGATDFAGKVVIIGVTDPSQKDFHATPYANNFYRIYSTAAAELTSGCEVHANIVATLADGRHIRTLDWLSSCAALVIAGALLGMLYANARLVAGAVLAAVHHFGWKGLSYLAFRHFDLRIELIGMLLVGFLAYGATFILRWRRLRRMLGVVKSEGIARALDLNPNSLDVLGERRVATVLFADIRNFTTFSETQSPHKVVSLLNAYFSEMVPILERHGGTLDQYAGDGMKVLFGAPQPDEDHALHAVQAAVTMVQRIRELRERWQRLEFGDLRIGVGIHTGEVVIGFVGSRRRLDYTAIGDTVNAAARIEAENRPLGTEILISAQTYKELPGPERARLGFAQEPVIANVKGKGQSLQLYPVTVE